MLFNGKPLTKPVKRKLGFVTQDDMLFGEVCACFRPLPVLTSKLFRSWAAHFSFADPNVHLVMLWSAFCHMQSWTLLSPTSLFTS